MIHRPITRICLAMTCILISGVPAGCQSANEADQRFTRIVSQLFVNRGLVEKTNRIIGASRTRRLTFQSQNGHAWAYIVQGKCTVNFDEMERTTRTGPLRTSARPFSSLVAIRDRYAARMSSVLGTSSLECSEGWVSVDRQISSGRYKYGRSELRFRIKKNGYAFIGKLYGAAITVDQISGEIITYHDSLAETPVSVPVVRLSESEARQSAATELGVSGSALQYIGLGYAAKDSGTAVVCYGYRHQSQGTMQIPGFVADTFIRADNGAVLKTDR